MAEGIWIQVLGAAAALIGAIVMWLLRKAAKWVAEKTNATEAEREAIQALLEGTALAQDEIVRAAKAAAADGKLTPEESQAAKTLAINHARAVATGPAKELLVTWSQERLGSLIKQLLAKLRK